MTKKSQEAESDFRLVKEEFLSYGLLFWKKNTQAQNVNTQLLTKLQGIMLMLQKIIFTTLDHDSPAINKIWCIDFITKGNLRVFISMHIYIRGFAYLE